MRRAFVLIYAVSGGAALVYEVTWTRLLTLQLGHGVAAASTVLAAFMGGLAIGSAVGGRVAARLGPVGALRIYAALELTIASVALVLPFGLEALEPLLARAYDNGNGGMTFGLLRLGASLLLVSIPASAMGATFPAAARAFVHHAGAAGREAGVLYAANTIGASLGALLAGFVLLPLLGLMGATWTAVALNGAAAAGALAIASMMEKAIPAPAAAHAAHSSSDASSKAEANSEKATRPAGRMAGRRATTPAHVARANPGRRALEASSPALTARPGLAAAALGISGFSSLALQVVWTRLLALMFGPTTYAFSTIVAVFIAGLAAGAALAARVASRTRRPLAGLALCLTCSVGLAAAAGASVDRGLLAVAEVVAAPGATFWSVLTRQALLALALLAPMTVAFGAAFPFAVAAAARRDDTIASDLGMIYAVNTAGAIAGALLAGFVFVPALGLHGTLRLIAIAGAAGALALLALDRGAGRLRVWAAITATGVLVLGILLPPWDRLLLSSGAYKYAATLQGPDLRTALTAGELLYYREGASGTVAVREVGGTTSLAIDGKVDASDAGDMLTQRLLAHVPLLLHPDPSSVAILGLGSGVTLGSALRHPIDRADVLEISPQVVEASRFFDDENHGALEDPRTRLILGDGRTHLLLTRDRYDVIVSEPSNPWMAGIASLFTREFFQAARQRLARGGVLCQWAHTYDISTRDLQSIIATFLSVFPDGMLWLVGDGDVLLIGSTDPLEPRLAGVAQAWSRPGVREDLAGVGATHPFHILSLFVAHGEALARWTEGAPVQSDNRVALEFSGPQSIFGAVTADNAVLLRELAARSPRPPAIAALEQHATPALIRDRGRMLLRADAFRPAYQDFVRALEADPDDASALEGLLRAAAPLQRHHEAEALLTRLAEGPGRTAKLALSRLLAAQGRYDQAAAIAFALARDNPNDVPALEQLASVLADAGDIERMRPVVARLRAVSPGTEATHYYSAALLFMENRIDLALAEARRVVALNPGHAKAQNLIGACLATLGRQEQARTAFQASLTADPRDPSTYTNLATLEMQAGNLALAEQYFAEALTIDPNHGPAREGLAQIRHR